VRSAAPSRSQTRRPLLPPGGAISAYDRLAEMGERPETMTEKKLRLALYDSEAGIVDLTQLAKINELEACTRTSLR
jgi:hypothetical protein